MPAESLRRYLDEEGIRYVNIRHSPAYTVQEIAFTAGTHSELIRMDFGDFAGLVEPTVGSFSVKEE